MKQQGGKTSQFVAHLATHFDGDNLDLPGFPEVLRRLEILLVDNNVDIQDVATLISSDPILTTKILQIANSATFNLSSAEIHNVDLAITRLGFELVRGITLAFAMRQALQQSWLVPIRSELEEIRRNSTDVASICGVIAKQVFKTRVDEAMLAGLVHQIGRLYIVVHTQKANAALEEEPDYQSTVGTRLSPAIFWQLGNFLRHSARLSKHRICCWRRPRKNWSFFLVYSVPPSCKTAWQRETR